jgi:hypothetical protein
MVWLGQQAGKSFAHFVARMKFGLAIGFAKIVKRGKGICW